MGCIVARNAWKTRNARKQRWAHLRHASSSGNWRAMQQRNRRSRHLGPPVQGDIGRVISNRRTSAAPSKRTSDKANSLRLVGTDKGKGFDVEAPRRGHCPSRGVFVRVRAQDRERAAIRDADDAAWTLAARLWGRCMDGPVGNWPCAAICDAWLHILGRSRSARTLSERLMAITRTREGSLNPWERFWNASSSQWAACRRSLTLETAPRSIWKRFGNGTPSEWGAWP